MVRKDQLYELFFEHSHILTGIEAALLRFLAHEADNGKTQEETYAASLDRLFAHNHKAEAALTSEHPALDGLSAAAALRYILENPTDTTLHTIELPQADPETLLLQSQKKPRLEKIPQRDPIPTEIMPKPIDPGEFEIISFPDEIDTIPTSSTHVHLNKQFVLNIAQVTRLLDRCPYLKIIQIPKGLHDNLVGASLTKLFAERGVTVIKGRLRNDQTYDERRAKGSLFEVEQAKFNHAFSSPKRRSAMTYMRAHNFIEFQVAELYYSSSNLSSRDIAEKLDLQLRSVQGHLRVFKSWLGVLNHSDYEGILERKIADHKRRNGKKRENEKIIKESSVGELLPPQTLHRKFWGGWQRIIITQALNPNATIYELLDGEVNPDFITIALQRYQIGEYRDTPHSLPYLANKYGVTKECIRTRLRTFFTKLNALSHSSV